MNIIVFGTGECYKKYRHMLAKMKILCLLDNDPDKQGKYIDGLLVEKPANINRYLFEFVFLLSDYYRDMRKQLLKMGIAPQKIVDKENKGFFENFVYTENYDCLKKGEKNILLISHAMNSSGAPIVLCEMAKILIRLGYDVTVFSEVAKNDGTVIYEYLKNGVSVRLYDEMVNIDVDDICREYDLIVINTVVLLPIVSMLSGKQIPVVWWLHEEEDAYNEFSLVRENFVLKKNIHVYTVGWRAKRTYEKYSCRKVEGELIYGVPFSSRKVKYSVKADKLIMAIIGNVCERKGQKDLCYIAQKNRELWEQSISFWLIGTISENDKLELSDGEYIKCFGLVTGEKLQQLYNNITVVICPSKNDPMPVTITDAFLRKIPCIMSNMTGQSKYIEQYKNGLVYETENIKQLEECIQWTIDNKDKLSQIGENGYKIYKEYFSMNSFEKKVESIIKKWIG